MCDVTTVFLRLQRVFVVQDGNRQKLKNAFVRRRDAGEDGGKGRVGRGSGGAKTQKGQQKR